jgi:hypothetical protein
VVVTAHKVVAEWAALVVVVVVAMVLQLIILPTPIDKTELQKQQTAQLVLVEAVVVLVTLVAANHMVVLAKVAPALLL